MTKVFNIKKVNWLKQPMFFGDEPNTQRYDQQKYPIFEKLTQQQLGFFWRPEEVSLQKDRNDFLTLSPEHEHIFTSNLKYQTLLDSVQGRGPCLALLPYCSLPELECLIVMWDANETIHSRSYTYIMKNVYPNPTEVLDTIITTKEIMERAKTVTESYDKFIDYANRYTLLQEGDRKELKKLLYLTLVNINILEGIRFYVSFACTFAFGELKLMEGSAKIVSLIARDENLHLAMSQNIINNYRLKENDKEMVQVIKDSEQEVYDMYNVAVQQEKDWAKYLFKDGQEAIDMAKSEMPDIILMDMGLPVKDGLEATREIKADEQTKNIPVIALTANAMGEHRQKAMDAGCDEYETKPVSLPELLGKIRNFT